MNKKKRDKPKNTPNYREQTESYQRGGVGGWVKQVMGIKSTLTMMSTE